jgi:Fe-S-cluster containining protein
MSCVYLTWHGSIASCKIYETRTKVCRSYVPGSSDLCSQYNKAGRAGKAGAGPRDEGGPLRYHEGREKR